MASFSFCHHGDSVVPDVGDGGGDGGGAGSLSLVERQCKTAQT